MNATVMHAQDAAVDLLTGAIPFIGLGTVCHNTEVKYCLYALRHSAQNPSPYSTHVSGTIGPGVTANHTLTRTFRVACYNRARSLSGRDAIHSIN